MIRILVMLAAGTFVAGIGNFVLGGYDLPSVILGVFIFLAVKLSGEAYKGLQKSDE